MENKTYSTGILLVLLLAITGGCGDRISHQFMPDFLTGTWICSHCDPGIKLVVSKARIRILRAGANNTSCNIESIVSYTTGWISRKQEYAARCDRQSTMRERREGEKIGALPKAPNDYRKTIYFRPLDDFREIKVSESEYMSKGYPDSEGIYDWKMGRFYKIR